MVEMSFTGLIATKPPSMISGYMLSPLTRTIMASLEILGREMYPLIRSSVNIIESSSHPAVTSMS